MPARKPPPWADDTQYTHWQQKDDYEYAQAIHNLKQLIDANWELKCLTCKYRRYNCGEHSSLVHSWAHKHSMIHPGHTVNVYNVAVQMDTYHFDRQQDMIEPPY